MSRPTAAAVPPVSPVPAAPLAQVLPEPQPPVPSRPWVLAQARVLPQAHLPVLAQAPILPQAHPLVLPHRQVVVPAQCLAGPADLPSRQSIVSRNGKEFTLTGETNIRAGTEIKVTTERPSVALRLSELDSGSWVIFELPGFATAASGTPQDSLDALRKASVTSYYKGKDSLWVKVVSNGEGARISGPGAGGTSVQVSR